MPKIRYVEKKFNTDHLDIIKKANAIIAEYDRQGFKLTLRQLYYQFVSKDWLANTVKNYKKLGNVVNDARLAGRMDWDAIEDRTRGTELPTMWTSPASILGAVAHQFRIDKWANQKYRPEVWIEKEALAGVIEPTCKELQIAFLSCRGYTSQSEMWASAMRMKQTLRAGQTPYVLHFGDHDPSGIDMTRDIRKRLEMFVGRSVKLERMALNMKQIEEYDPPPNPAKTTDARFTSYAAIHGDESWELDALEPTILAGLIRGRVLAVRDADLWADKVEEEKEHRKLLRKTSGNWAELTKIIDRRDDPEPDADDDDPQYDTTPTDEPDNTEHGASEEDDDWYGEEEDEELDENVDEE